MEEGFRVFSLSALAASMQRGHCEGLENKTLFGKHGKQTLAVTGRSKEEVKNWAEVITFLSKVNLLREQPFYFDPLPSTNTKF